MAIITLNCNLNGGDSVTPNNELFYRVYGDIDNYSSPIHTTDTATADSDVTVTGDVVDISNVDGTTNTSFKIAAVDGVGNEGVLSDAVSGSIILFQDDFAGTTIDTNKWTVTNPNSPGIEISQNDGLIFNTNGTTGTISATANYAQSKPPASASTIVLRVNINKSENSTFTPTNLIRFRSSVDDTDFAVIQVTPSGSSANAKIGLYQNGAVEYELLDAVNMSGAWKIVNSNNEWSFYRWDGVDTWTQIGVTQTLNIGTSFEVFACQGSLSTTTQITTYSDLYITDADFSTLNPT